jgi:hypothetical protein
MEYVMVPVPEELVGEVRTFLAWGLLQSAEPVENPAALVAVVQAGDESSRRLLRLLADDTLEEKSTTLREAAEALDTTTREVVGLAGELNFDIAQAGGGALTIIGKVDPRPIKPGVRQNDHRILLMTESVAKVIAGLSLPD